MTTLPLVASTKEDAVAIVRMQDETGRNSFTENFLAELRAALQTVAADRSVRVILLCGLPDVFCSGAPLELLRQLSANSLSPSELYLPRELLQLPLPCIAAMQGHAAGGGLALGLCADMTVVARESRYGASFMNMGFTPGMGMTRLLEHAMLPSLAHEMLYTGGFYRGSEFEGGRGFNRVVTKDEVENVAMDMALQIAEKPRTALELLKKTLANRRLKKYEADFQTEALMHRICFNEAETRRFIEDNYAQ